MKMIKRVPKRPLLLERYIRRYRDNNINIENTRGITRALLDL